MEDPDIPEILKCGVNSSALTCLHCGSRIIDPSMGSYIEREFTLPHMRQQKNQIVSGVDCLKDFFQVRDVYHFENITISNTKDGVKYLACADCEMGPIGWQDLQTQACFIAISRVKCS